VSRSSPGPAVRRRPHQRSSPKFDEGKLTAAVAAQGVTLCPDAHPSGGDITGGYEKHNEKVYVNATFPCSALDDCYSATTASADLQACKDQARAGADVEVTMYASQRTFDRGTQIMKRVVKAYSSGGSSFAAPTVGWSWKPVILLLDAGGSPDLTAKLVAAVKTLKPKPKVLFDKH
jgi:hypothetical protein